MNCPPGTYGDSETSTCKDCIPGFYQDEDGKTECQPCPKNYSSVITGSKSSADCRRKMNASGCNPLYANTICLYGKWKANIFFNLKILGKIFDLPNLRDLNVTESIYSHFQFSIHLLESLREKLAKTNVYTLSSTDIILQI